MFLYAFQQALSCGYEGLRSKCITNDRGLMDVLDACDGLDVQNNYDAYLTFPKKVNAKEAVAAVLWATESIERQM